MIDIEILITKFKNLITDIDFQIAKYYLYTLIHESLLCEFPAETEVEFLQDKMDVGMLLRLKPLKKNSLFRPAKNGKLIMTTGEIMTLIRDK